MRLKTFDKTERRTPTPKSKVPFLTVNRLGKFNFSQAARRAFDLKEGDRIVFHQDLDYRSDWYFELTQEERGYKLVFGKTDTRFTSVNAGTHIFKSIGLQPQKLTFLIHARPYIHFEIPLYKLTTKIN